MGQLRIWADNSVYGSGHGAFTGLANKADPGATIAGDGIVPGEEFQADHLNHQLHEQSVGALQARQTALASFELLTGGYTSVSSPVGATYVDHLDLVAFAIGGDCWLVGDAPFASNPGSSNVDVLNGVMLYNPTTQRLHMLGTGTNTSAISDNDGTTWSASTTQVGIATDAGLWLTGNTLMATPLETTANTSVRLTTDDGANWAGVAVGGAELGRGIARCGLDNNAVLVIDVDGDVYTADDSNYASWTYLGSVPELGSVVSPGYVDSDSAGTTYYAAEYGDGIRLYSKASPSAAWEQVALLPALPSGATVDNTVLRIDKTTDLIYVVVCTSDLSYVHTSVDGGETWVRATLFGFVNVSGTAGIFQAAGGRFWYRSEGSALVRSASRWVV